MSNTKIIKEGYVLSKNCRMVFNAKGEKVPAGSPYILLETTRGKAVLDPECIAELTKDLKDINKDHTPTK